MQTAFLSMNAVPILISVIGKGRRRTKMIRRIFFTTLILALFTGCDSHTVQGSSSEETNTTEVIDGHILPPEPDPAVNNGTLLGVDVNDNGVRDDVERYIYHRFSQEEFPKTKIAIAMQYGRALQKILVDPEHAYENETYRHMEKAHDCQWYFYDKHLGTSYMEGREFRKQNPVFDEEFKDKVFNTKNRLEAYFAFNASLSGHGFPGRKKTVDKCETDIDEFGE
jgi:hypothetical protein